MNIRDIEQHIPFAIFGIICLLLGIFAIDFRSGVVATGLTALVIAVMIRMRK